MVARNFLVRHGDEEFPIEYDTEDGLEVLKFQIFSVTSVTPENQKILVDDGNIVITESFDLESISDKLRLVSLDAEAAGSGDGEAEGLQVAQTKSLEMASEELARMLQEIEYAGANSRPMFHPAADGRVFEQRIRPMLEQVLSYEDLSRQEAARISVPVDEIEEKASVWLAKEGTFYPSKDEKDDAFLLQLLFWFKESFRWVDSPQCDSCGSETSAIGMDAPLPSEIQFGCSRVEIYRCNRNCSRITRFPRYNEPLKLLETRRGRCGEWANCFTLYCRAFGYDSRLILDFTDHLWTECFSRFHGRWMHLDPCDGAYDNPLIYEKGWKKKLSYIIAISKDGVCDVTKRYTRKWPEVLSRRNITMEAAAAAVLSNLTRECRIRNSSEISSMLENRDKREAEELEMVHLQDDASLSLTGRQSGTKEWRMARSELGSGEDNPLTYISCPVRTCIDDHVRNIYSSLSRLLSHFVNNKVPKAEALKNIVILKRLLLHLKSNPFKTRMTFVNLKAASSQLYKQTLPSLDEFLSAISLKKEPHSDEKICITLSGNPVQTSIALPVALDSLEEIIEILNRISYFDERILSDFSRMNRITSGSVLASGEQLPFGIATAAFDGGRTFKWEEPIGARGCWLLYKVKDGEMHVLQAYELTSANDAPERDPMDWIVDGSEDGGSSWRILDQQTSQIFQNRFQRKRFKVKSGGACNAFRFRFLKVRDPEKQGRFHIVGIDLYAA